MNAPYFTAAWRVAVLLLLSTIAAQMLIANRELRAARDQMPHSTEISTLEEKLDTIHSDLEDLWALTNELVK